METIFLILLGCVGLLIILLIGEIADLWPKQVAFLCWECKGNGMDRYDPEFNCEKCDGTGIIISKEDYLQSESEHLHIIWWRFLRVWKKQERIER